MNATTPPAPIAPTTATVTLAGRTLTLGRMKLRPMRERAADLRIVQGLKAGEFFTTEQIDALVRIVHASAWSHDNTVTLEHVTAFFLDAEAGYVQAIEALSNAFAFSQELCAPKGEPAAPGEA